MRLMRSLAALLIAGLLLMVVMNSVSGQKTERIATGLWGGAHISMEVGEQSAKVEYDCAHGVIEGPLVVDSEGKFRLRGTLTPERGGPVRADESERALAATYAGEVKGNTMTLTLKVSDEDETETFTLEKGKTGKLMKCK
jgi:hypothetical protein